MIEMALMLPLLMVLVAGIVELGDALNTYLTVVSASRDAARIGAKGSANDSTLQALVITDTNRLRNATTTGNITITRGTFSSVSAITVRVCNSHALVMNYPLLPISGPMNICASSTMRVTAVGS